MPIWIGIDPGFKGAIGYLHDTRGPYVWDTPVVCVNKNGKNRTEYDVASMAEIVRSIIGGVTGPKEEAKVAVERVHSMPKMGSVGAFSFGTGYGIWLGILAALQIPYDLVEPGRWKKVMMDGMGKEKSASRFRAQQLWPMRSDLFKLVKHDGRAEALLIAEYRRRLG